MDSSLSQAIPDAESRTRIRVMAACLVAAIVLTFGRLVAYAFLTWDDVPFIAGEPMFMHPSWHNVWLHWRRPFHDIYVPVTSTIWQFLAWASHRHQPDASGLVMSPELFHVANILVHIVSSLIVFHLLRRLLKSDWPALAGALLYALHPVQVETVGWISGLKDLLAGAGSLGAIALYLAAGDQRGTRRGKLLYVAAVVTLLLALLSKPSAMTTPAVMFAIDVLLLCRRWSKSALRLAPFFVVSLVIAFLARYFQPPITGTSDLGYELNVSQAVRPLIAGHSVAFYMGHVLWPVRLGVDYGHFPAFVAASAWGKVAWIVPLAVIGLAVSAYRRSPVPLAAVAIFILAPFHVLGWVPFDQEFFSTTADHYLYVAMFGVALLAGWVCTVIPRRTVMLLTVAVAIALGVRSFVQAGTWRDSRTLFEHALVVNRNSWGNHTSLAQIAIDQKDWQAAVDHARQAIALQPTYVPPYIGLGNGLTQLGDYRGALQAYRYAVERRPDLAAPLAYLGSLQARLGDLGNAEKNLKRALQRDPNFSIALLNYGTLLAGRGDLAAAEPLLRRVVQLAPTDARARVNLARCLAAMGRREEAVEQAQIAYSLQPDYPSLAPLMRDLAAAPSTTLPAAP